MFCSLKCYEFCHPHLPHFPPPWHSSDNLYTIPDIYVIYNEKKRLMGETAGHSAPKSATDLTVLFAVRLIITVIYRLHTTQVHNMYHTHPAGNDGWTF